MKGMEYYPRKADFYQSPKIRNLIRKCGLEGLYVYEILEAEAHREYGYYVLLSDDLRETLIDDLDLEEDELKKIIDYLLKREFILMSYDDDGYQVVTSKRWQENFLPVARERARKRESKVITVRSDIWLIPDEEFITFI